MQSKLRVKHNIKKILIRQSDSTRFVCGGCISFRIGLCFDLLEYVLGNCSIIILSQWLWQQNKTKIRNLFKYYHLYIFVYYFERFYWWDYGLWFMHMDLIGDLNFSSRSGPILLLIQLLHKNSFLFSGFFGSRTHDRKQMMRLIFITDNL